MELLDSMIVLAHVQKLVFGQSDGESVITGLEQSFNSDSFNKWGVWRTEGLSARFLSLFCIDTDCK